MGRNEDLRLKKTIAKNVRCYAFINEMTLNTMAVKAHIAPSTLYSRLQCASDWKIGELLRIADAVGVTVHDLMKEVRI